MSPRVAYAIATVATIGVGLGSRTVAVPASVGDGLWAMMVFFGLSTIAPRLALRIRAAIAFAYCLATELSQLYHAPWIDDLRATRLGALVLGHGFLWTDVVAYAVGVLAAAALGRLVDRTAR